MKKALILCAILSISAFYSCRYEVKTAPDAVMKCFESRFPDATRIEWERDMGQFKASFSINDQEKEAWFEKEGDWVRTKTDISLSEVPEAVLETARNYKDGEWKIENIDYFEQASGVSRYYRVEYDRENSEKERIVRIIPEGSIITDYR